MNLSTTTKILHAIVGLSMISLIAVGIYMHETKTFALYDIHKSFGVLIFAFALSRVIVRVKEGWPKPLETNTAKLQLIVAKVIHWGLIVSTVLYPVSGMMMSGAGGHGIPLFGIELLASNYDAVTQKAVPLNETLASLGHELHESLTGVLILFIVLHVVGALKHHIIDKDETIKRMFSFK